MFIDRLEGTPVEEFTYNKPEAPEAVEPTHASIAECRWLTGDRADLIIEWHDREWEEFIITPAISGERLDVEQLEDDITANCEAFGYEVVGIEEQFRGLVVSFRPLSFERVNGRAKVRKAKLDGSRYALAQRANMRFKGNEKRLEVMASVISNWSNYWEPQYTDSSELPSAWIDRLFDEGMVQRSNKSVELVRPTVAGIKWFRREAKKASA